MKRSEAILSISDKLQKSQNLLDGYKNASINLKCLCDNLAIRILNHCEEEISMYPPDSKNKCNDPALQIWADNIDIPHWIILGWDNEED
jgi:hypothetical protein